MFIKHIFNLLDYSFNFVIKEIYWKLGDSGSSTSCGMDGPRLRYLPSGRGRDGFLEEMVFSR